MKSIIFIKYVLMASIAILVSWPVAAQERSFLCKFTSGPRSGQVQDYTGHPQGPLPVGSSCQDGAGSAGVIVSSSNRAQRSSQREDSATDASSGNSGGSCRNPSTEEDCDKCGSDRSYDRCLEKL